MSSFRPLKAHEFYAMPSIEPYAKSFEDELDWKMLDQLHGAVSQISNFCFEIKKFCVTTEIAVLAVLIKFTSEKLDHSIFVTGILIPLCFWFLDAIGYFYQVKLRGLMENIRSNLTSRNAKPLVIESGTPFIDTRRIQKHWAVRSFQAAFNHSMWAYAALIVTDACIWFLFATGRIK